MKFAGMRIIAWGAAAATTACAEPQAPVQKGRTATPSCPRGSFMAQVDAIFPAIAPTNAVTLLPATSIRKNVEPGCVVPFRNEPDDRVLDVGRVVGKTLRRSVPGDKLRLVGRGRLQLGRGVLRLVLTDDAGDTTLDIAIDGHHARLSERDQKPFDADVTMSSDDPLPLPLDALVASLDRCDADQRLGRTADGNVIEARRGDFMLWRSRWIDARGTSVVDTSIACADTDARMLWRSGTGDILPMIAVASARADRVLVIVRQNPAQVDDADDTGIVR